jgi:ribosomal-protein-alanine N-acetyltransferase
VPRDIDLVAATAWVEWSRQAREAGEALFLAIVYGGVCVGSVGLIHLEHEHRRAEVGYWLLPEARGHRLTVRGLELLVTWTFENLDVARLDLFTNTDNGGSMAVAERCGFIREALLRSWHLTPWGEREDLVLFGLLREDFR